MDENNEIMLDLLCKQAMYGLTDEETVQLEQFNVNSFDTVSFDMTAAAIGMIDLRSEQMPDHLHASVLARADEFFGWNSVEKEISETPSREVYITAPKSRVSFMDWFGWAVAAAACIALAVNIYSNRDQPIIANNGSIPLPTVEEKSDPAQQRQRLIDSSAQVVLAQWGKGNVKEIAEVSGDVVWSDAKQAGYVRVKGLPKNDVSKETYQLWIFDETQDKATPIDGGTFDINADGEVIIPIDPKLNAKNPSLFAITIEKRGGVVLSKRGKLAALAAVKPNLS